MNIGGFIVGLVIFAGCGYGLYRLADYIIAGFSQHDLWIVGGGALLAYFFGGLLIAGVICGLFFIWESTYRRNWF